MEFYFMVFLLPIISEDKFYFAKSIYEEIKCKTFQFLQFIDNFPKALRFYPVIFSINTEKTDFVKNNVKNQNKSCQNFNKQSLFLFLSNNSLKPIQPNLKARQELFDYQRIRNMSGKAGQKPNAGFKFIPSCRMLKLADKPSCLGGGEFRKKRNSNRTIA